MSITSPGRPAPSRPAPSRPAPSASLPALDRFFRITERGSTVARELRGGVVTFFTMSYILVLNPLILGSALAGDGDVTGAKAKIAAGTALIAGVMTILMGVVANYPLAMAAGLGINAMVAYTIVGNHGMTFADAMGIVVIEGVIILILVLTGFREAVFRAVPPFLRTAISVGIGLFIALIGLVDAKVVRVGGTPLELGLGGSLKGWPVIVFLLGLFLTIILHIRKVRGAILIGIVSATLLAVIIEAVQGLGAFEEGSNPTGWALSVPSLSGSPVSVPDLSGLGHFSLLGSFEKAGAVSIVLLVFSMMLADFFDTMGTMVAIGAEGGLLDEDGNPPRTREILVVDSVGAIAGGLGAVSSNTSYVESAAGVGEGARTGLANIVTGALFLASVFLSPIVAMVPYEAATPALVVVGFLMMTQVADIDWKRPELGIPAFMTIIMMPFSYSITNGIGAGFLTYALVEIAVGRARRVHPLMWLTAALFAVYFTMAPIKEILGLA
ncbi:NCS2 family nucleobase:cation symporter-2 [Actinomyces sp. Chiba101]|nr:MULTISPECIES: NCS2 family permease [Actinomyces]BAW94030.1 NCS2 family nucleobase:cation symporter-2 [Actinomyces sp. Chiba101]GAV95421.1 NCS2 family nucleobase:cation symporter-2 [Actinomyces denticolens]SUU14327.1 Guanine/hypoxanthine permease pbuG [Actinomyces denticolens]